MDLILDGKDYHILQGNNIETLKKLPDGSVDCVVTSPPYYGLRAYLPDDSEFAHFEIGREITPKQFIEKLVEVFHEVFRVLSDDGVLWLNIGDSYSSYKNGTHVPQSFDKSENNHKNRPKTGAPNRSKAVMEAAGFKNKELIGIPWMLAFALREDGWLLRQDVIWQKAVAMPESVKDRCTRSHEYVFMFTKQPCYFYDHEAIKEDTVDGNERKNKRSVWTIATSKYKGAHFATFPEELVEPCVLSSCKPGGIVLDPFNGAATTGVVALKHGMKYIGCELNPEYVELSEKRLNECAEKVAETNNGDDLFNGLFGN